MRYFSYNEYVDDDYDDQGGYIVTMSEEEIRQKYWPYWYKKMCDKFGQELVDEKYSFEDCLDDWIVVNCAWEVKE